MKKSKRNGDSVFDVSGRDVELDERGRVKKDRDADEAGRRTGTGKKKKRVVKEAAFEEVPDKKFKSGMDAKDGKLKKKKRKTGLIIEGESKRLAVYTPSQAKEKIAKKKSKAIKAIEEFALLPDTGDEFDSQYRDMFENSVELASRLELQMVEHNIKSSDVYALNSLYSQIRELIADMRATKDIGQQISELEQVALNPFTKQVGQFILDLYFTMQSNISAAVKDRDIREDLLRKLGDAAADAGLRAQGEHAVMVDKVRKVLA
jgi:hypothetical protein